MVAFDLLDEGDDRSLVGDIDADADTADLLCDRGGAGAVEIGDVHDRRAVGGEAPSHGSTDTACGSGDDDDCSLNLHGADRRPFGPSTVFHRNSAIACQRRGLGCAHDGNDRRGFGG